MEPQLEHLVSSIGLQTRAVRDLVASVSDRAFVERPGPDTWSMAQHLAHLALVNRPYLDAMASAVEKGKEKGLTGTGPFKGKWFAARFIRSMEPPPRWRFKTLKEMKPTSSLNTATVLEEFEGVQARYTEIARSADGLHLGRLTFRSPFTRLLRFTLLQGFELLDAHNRRHLWHVDRMREDGAA